MLCPKCNKQLSATAVFCPACGTKVVRENNVGQTQDVYKRNTVPDVQYNAAPQTAAQQNIHLNNGQEFNRTYNNYDYEQQKYRPYDYSNKQAPEKEQYKNQSNTFDYKESSIEKNINAENDKNQNFWPDYKSYESQSYDSYNKINENNSAEQLSKSSIDNAAYSNANSYKEIEYKLEDDFEQNNEDLLSNNSKKKKKKIIIAIIIAFMVICLAVIAYVLIEMGVFSSTEKDGYEEGISLMNSGKYTEAIAEFEKLNGYKDSESKIEECNNAIKYAAALSLMESGKYIEAIAVFEELGKYNDSSKKITECMASQYKNVETGDYIEFGNYEQDNEESNGKESIEWLVIEKQEDKIFIVSKYALDCAPYNVNDKDITWEECSLRSWLNNDFINNAFSATEKTIIQSTKVINDNVEGGNDTTDNVFLLSISEAEKYFKTEQERICKSTTYAANKTTDDYDMGFDTCWWWLRSSGKYGNYASGVNYIGSINDFGDNVYNEKYFVRPALWISLQP